MPGVSKMTLVIALGGLALVCVRKLLGHLGIASAGVPPVRAAAPMTNAERRVIGYVEQAMPQARIHAQVSMGALGFCFVRTAIHEIASHLDGSNEAFSP